MSFVQAPHRLIRSPTTAKLGSPPLVANQWEVVKKKQKSFHPKEKQQHSATKELQLTNSFELLNGSVDNLDDDRQTE